MFDDKCIELKEGITNLSIHPLASNPDFVLHAVIRPDATDSKTTKSFYAADCLNVVTGGDGTRGTDVYHFVFVDVQLPVCMCRKL